MRHPKSKFRIPTRTLVFTALMTALVTTATVTLGFRTGDFFFNCGDAVIFITAAMFGPLPAAVAGGLGSFFADLAVYPATMFFTLFVKGIEGLVCGLLMKLLCRRRKFLDFAGGTISMTVAGATMMTGYFVCNTYFYGTPASGIAALPADAVQAAISVAIAVAVLYVMRLVDLRERFGLSRTDFDKKLHSQEYIRIPRQNDEKEELPS